MEKENRFVWIVETRTYRQHPQCLHRENEKVYNSYFSSEEKAKIHVEWQRECAKNNGMAQVYSDEGSFRYRFPNCETFEISTTRVPLDMDDDLIGEA